MYGKQQKKIAIQSTDKVHAELKIRLKYDGLTQQFFFGSLVEGYLRRDENIMIFVAQLKEDNKIQTISKRRKVKKMNEAASETETKFGLNKEEIESIFDIIQEE